MTNNDDLFLKIQNFIREENDRQTNTLKKEISSIKEAVAVEQGKIRLLEKEVEELKYQSSILEKQTRRNNIIVFNLKFQNGDLVKFTLSKINEFLKLNITENDINNIYTVGKQATNKPIVVQFISFLKKKLVLKNCYNLKDTDVIISEDLSLDEKEERKLLVNHLKLARSQQKKAHIRGNKLYIEGEVFTAADFEERSPDDENDMVAKGNVNKKKASSTANKDNVPVSNNQVRKRRQDTSIVRSSSRVGGKGPKSGVN